MAKRLLLILLILSFFSGFSQPVSSFQQFTGSYDFTMIGNTLNSDPNGTGASCTILTQSSANLNMAANQTVVAAYLYWSGSGSLQQIGRAHSELQSRPHLVCRLLLEKKKTRLLL